MRLATTQMLVCSCDWNAEHALRGLLANKRLEAVALHGTGILVDIFASSPQAECLVHSPLSDVDRNRLTA